MASSSSSFQSMTTSSSSSSSQSRSHDVYLSFRGEDTRMTFVDHLYSALVQQGIHTYLDEQSLPRGKPIRASLDMAIVESRIVVVILSKNYAASASCLDDLVHIMKCKDETGKTVIPVFYDVEPSQVRTQTLDFGEGFFRLGRKFDDNKIESWRKALKDVSMLSGWVAKHDGNEAQLVKNIVDEISYKLFYHKHPVEMGTDHFNTPPQDMLLAASSSSSSHFTPPSQSSKHDVFISFNAFDTCKPFVDHLYSALAQKEIYTYQDEEPLRLAKAITPSQLKAIEESRIALIIFSKKYAESSLCLEELVHIMKCKYERGQIVFPIYYHVGPSEVRRQTGDFGEAFDKHYELENKNIDSWRRAVAKASNLAGWDTKGYEAKLVKDIVDKISYRLSPNKDLVQTGIDHLKISLKDILLATNRFSEATIIARSGFGKVYRGQSAQHGIIAVKKLDRVYGQGDREFTMEIALLSICKHENIVSLVGFCDESGEKILVYGYEKNGSLDKHLRSKDLTWMHRLRICIGTAFGLKYLHDDVGPQRRVIHRDMKSANILLDENWKPKISDFGLSKIALANVPLSALVSNPCGTPGYCDPQYLGHSTLTQKSDVYSFGVVLFEVLFGRAVTVAEYPDENHFSVKMARNHYEQKTLEEIINADLRNQMKAASLRVFSSVAYRCVKEHGEERPRMIQVIEQLVKALNYQQDVAV